MHEYVVRLPAKSAAENPPTYTPINMNTNFKLPFADSYTGAILLITWSLAKCLIFNQLVFFQQTLDILKYLFQYSLGRNDAVIGFVNHY